VTTTPRSLLRRLLGARGAALLIIGARHPSKALTVGVILAAALWCGALARADTSPSPTTPTTTTDAPPPDPYQAPARTVKKQPAARRVAVTRPAPAAPTHTYTPPAVTRSQSPPVRSTRPAVKPRAKQIRRPRKRPAHARQQPISLAPLADLAATIRTPLPVSADDERPFRLLAGITLAVLAVAGFGLLLLSLRVFRTAVGVR
jgi:hypothetical protein